MIQRDVHRAPICSSQSSLAYSTDPVIARLCLHFVDHFSSTGRFASIVRQCFHFLCVFKTRRRATFVSFFASRPLIHLCNCTDRPTIKSLAALASRFYAMTVPVVLGPGQLVTVSFTASHPSALYCRNVFAAPLDSCPSTRTTQSGLVDRLSSKFFSSRESEATFNLCRLYRFCVVF